jgi:hypothetical protein
MLTAPSTERTRYQTGPDTRYIYTVHGIWYTQCVSGIWYIQRVLYLTAITTPAINEGCTRSLRISHTSRRTPLQPVPKAQVPCTPYRPPNRTGVIPVPALALPPRPGPRRAQRVCRFAAALQSAPTNALPQHGQHLLSEGTVYNYMYFGCLNRVYREGACVHSLTCPSTDTATTSSLRNASFRLRNVRIVLRNVSFRRAAASLGVQARLQRVEQAQHTLHAPSL